MMRLSNLLQTYWTNFAKSGEPNASGLPDWPSWSDEKTEFLVINKDGSVTMQHNFAASQQPDSRRTER